MPNLMFVLTIYLCLMAFLVVFRVLSSERLALPPAARGSLAALSTMIVILLAFRQSMSPWTLSAVMATAALASVSMSEPGLTGLTRAFGRWRFAVFLLATVTVSALIFIFVPITTFLTSPGELAVNLDFLFGTNASNAMQFVYIAALLYALSFTSRMRTTLTTVALGLLLLMLVYGFALPLGYPRMSGLAFEQVPITGSEQRNRLMIDIAVIAALGALLGPLVIRMGGKSLVVGIVLVNFALVATAGIQIHRDTLGGAGGPDQSVALNQQPIRFSKTDPNVLIIFLDRFMGSYVESILESDPELGDTLEGFTWYPRSLSAGENSIAGIHPLLGGYDYLPVEMNRRNQPLRDLSVEAFSILPYNFAKQGWGVNLVSPRGLGFTMAGDCSFLDIPGINCTHIPETLAQQRAAEMGFSLNELARSNYTDLLVLLAALRVAPYGLKETLIDRGPWRPYMDHSAGTTFREWAKLDGLETLTSTEASRPTFNFVSNLLPHEPYFMGEDCLPRAEAFHLPESEIERRGHDSLFSLQHAIAARCVLLLVGDYLSKLKQLGVYDNTYIVVVSDHGIVGKVRDTSSRAVAGGTESPDYVRTRSLLLVKPRNAKGPLAISEEFMPNAEVPRLVCTELGGCVNPYLGNKPIVVEGRNDPFYISHVPWQFSQQNKNSFDIRKQFALTGKDPFDAEGWSTVEEGSIW